jgi:hypothetical protein
VISLLAIIAEIEIRQTDLPTLFPVLVLGFLCLITILLAAILVVLLIRRNK